MQGSFQQNAFRKVTPSSQAFHSVSCPDYPAYHISRYSSPDATQDASPSLFPKRPPPSLQISPVSLQNRLRAWKSANSSRNDGGGKGNSNSHSSPTYTSMRFYPHIHILLYESSRSSVSRWDIFCHPCPCLLLLYNIH